MLKHQLSTTHLLLRDAKLASKRNNKKNKRVTVQLNSLNIEGESETTPTSALWFWSSLSSIDFFLTYLFGTRFHEYTAYWQQQHVGFYMGVEFWVSRQEQQTIWWKLKTGSHEFYLFFAIQCDNFGKKRQLPATGTKFFQNILPKNLKISYFLIFRRRRR